jgi:hypothetical protein
MRNVYSKRPIERREDNTGKAIISIPLQTTRRIRVCEEGFQLLQANYYSLTMHDNPSEPGEEARRYVKLRQKKMRNPKLNKQRLHKVLYVLKHGPVPNGFSVKPINGDWDDYRLENLGLFDRWNDRPYRQAVLKLAEKSATEAKEWKRFNAKANRNIRQEPSTLA